MRMGRTTTGGKLSASLPPVDIVTQEQVVYVGDVASCVGCTIFLKEAHEVTKLAMQVAKDLDGGLHTMQRQGVRRIWSASIPLGLCTMLEQSTTIPVALRQPLSAAPHRWLLLLVVRKWLLLLVRVAWRSRRDNYFVDLRCGVCHSP